MRKIGGAKITLKPKGFAAFAPTMGKAPKAKKPSLAKLPKGITGAK